MLLKRSQNAIMLQIQRLYVRNPYHHLRQDEPLLSVSATTRPFNRNPTLMCLFIIHDRHIYVYP